MPDWIKPLAPNNNREEKSFRYAIVGGTRSGKSTLLHNLVFKLLKKDLKRVIVFGGKSASNEELKTIFKKEKPPFDLEIFKRFDDDKIGEILDEIDSSNSKSKDNKQTLFVFEDLTAENASDKSKNNNIDRVIMNGGELNVSTIITAQKYGDLKKSTRSGNISKLFLFEIPMDQANSIYREQNLKIGKDDFKELAKTATETQYEFLVISQVDNINEKLQDSNFKPIQLSSGDGENKEDGELLKGAKAKRSEKKTPTKVTLMKLEKGDSKAKMFAIFKVNGKIKKIPFGGVKGTGNKKNPLDPEALEENLLKGNGSFTDKVKSFRKKFGV